MFRRGLFRPCRSGRLSGVFRCARFGSRLRPRWGGRCGFGLFGPRRGRVLGGRLRPRWGGRLSSAFRLGLLGPCGRLGLGWLFRPRWRRVWLGLFRPRGSCGCRFRLGLLGPCGRLRSGWLFRPRWSSLLGCRFSGVFRPCGGGRFSGALGLGCLLRPCRLGSRLRLFRPRWSRRLIGLTCEHLFRLPLRVKLRPRVKLIIHRLVSSITDQTIHIHDITGRNIRPPQALQHVTQVARSRHLTRP